jgi:hypothetical protein
VGTVRYRCPGCGFQIFNRRVPKCESCGAALPAEFLLSREQVAALDAEHKKSMKERAARAQAGRDDGGDAGTFLELGGDGDGGGSD